MENELLKIIETIPNLTEEDKKEIEGSIVVKQFSKGIFLLKENEVSHNCYFVVKGCVRQYIIKEGIEKTTAFYTEGDSIVSYTSYTKREPSTHYLVCTEACLIALSDADYEKRIHEKYPAIKDFVHKDTAIKMGKFQEELSLFMTSSPEARYLNLLQNKPDLLNRVPQHQIASYISVTPESLSRIRKRILRK